jgi:hypothetical protein
MKLIAPIAIFAAALCAPLAHAQDAAAVEQAKQAATRWLAAADQGNGSMTWDQAAGPFQAAVSKGVWSDALTKVREPFGAMKSRELVSADYTKTLPGAPEGEYVLIQYSTKFEKGNAVETVTPMRDKDGSWKVSGYYVK